MNTNGHESERKCVTITMKYANARDLDLSRPTPYDGGRPAAPARLYSATISGPEEVQMFRLTILFASAVAIVCSSCIQTPADDPAPRETVRDRSGYSAVSPE